LKPHPGREVNLADYPGLRIDQTDRALTELLGDYDVAVAGNSTSAAVDAFVAGLPVVISLDGESLNMSPLRGCRGVRFVTSSAELVHALQTAQSEDARQEGLVRDFFYMDKDLPRWKRLLGRASGD
jgi:surface carbohydrate biosynthesis protein (TIGR04326 family)